MEIVIKLILIGLFAWVDFILVRSVWGGAPYAPTTPRNLELMVGLAKRAIIHQGSYWPVDLSQFSIVMVFGRQQIMKRLEGKLQRELLPGARVIANTFPFPNWQSQHVEQRVYVYCCAD
ncbi:MAG: hypothetical protein HYV33_05815 [Candidatus Kerfeldbacteria bacterium]|nr:hypothetical protein [Candidatus Kerfeldbacteria bacterium]